MTLVSCCSTREINISPSLLEDCDKYLPKLKAGDSHSLLLWKLETDNKYYECRDKHKALKDAIK